MFASQVGDATNLMTTVARDLDASALSGREATRLVEELGRLRAVVDGLVGRVAKRVAATDAHLLNGDRNAAAFVARTLGAGCGEARAAIDTAGRLEALPTTAAAVAAGNLSRTEAEMIAGAAAVNPQAEARLLKAAAQGLVTLKDECLAVRAEVEDPAARSARQRKLREFRMWTDTDGMLAGRFRLQPELGGQLEKIVKDAVQRKFRAHKGNDHESHESYAADVLVERMLAEPSDDDAKVSKVTVHVNIDHGALMRGGAVEGEVCEIAGVGPVSVEWVKEILGQAVVKFVITNGRDITTIASTGRHVRADVQTALVVSGHECDIAGCGLRGYLERDHVLGYAVGGPTTYANLIWLCYAHHRLKTAGWILGPPDPETRKRSLRAPPGWVAA